MIPKKVEKLAKACWEYYHPNGGSIFPNYESLPEGDKVQLREQASDIADYLDGLKIIGKS